MSIDITIQNATDSPDLPETNKIRQWVKAALNGHADNAEITVRIVDETESRQLNEKWRKLYGPTNVLSFPYNNDRDTSTLLGDIVICASVVIREADDQNKMIDAHWAHMVVHGILHLLGFDHIDSKDAERMEALEIKILNGLGYPDPYTYTDK